MTSGWSLPEPEGWRTLVEIALAEDIGTGDISAAAVPPGTSADWYVEVQQPGVACGIGAAAAVLGPGDVEVLQVDGDTVGPGTVLLRGHGDARHLLTRERTALNFLMHLGGVATLTSRYVEALAGTGCRLLDTRKTTPGLRHMEKYAVRCGGGTNYRVGLYDMAMLKDNHLQAAGSIAAALAAVRPGLSPGTMVEVECADLDMVAEAVASGADIVMLDNMTLADMAEAVRRHKGKTLFEASGGVTLQTVRAIGETGVDFVSVGALTHSAPALSVHLEFGVLGA
ncbi:MAG: carboxylating nicotinate-nucleotide diphosphorylase [Fimbriimonadaceae bacterium]|nr:carboxylating nicotinate-nucleotide diphosphorylase [Fimbriimonadaceae bacterium]